MFNKKTFAVILTVGFFIVSTGFSQTLKDNWEDFLDFTEIGNFDLAKGYAQLIVDNPDPVVLFNLSREDTHRYQTLLRLDEFSPDPELTQLTRQIIGIIEQGSSARRSDSEVIAEEIRRLNSQTERGRQTAITRLKNAGEYAIRLMIDAMLDSGREEEIPNIELALPKIGRDAIRPLAAALQIDDIAMKAGIIKALGEIGYPQALPYLKYIVEKDGSEELRSLARENITLIRPAALDISSAELFYQLAEQYYYHTSSLSPAENADLLNIWFWDSENRRLDPNKVADDYFYELMAMRCCEWALKADSGYGPAIGLWIASYFKAESTGLQMPEYFGQDHADALTYATTAGVEYLHQALARAIRDRNSYVALGAIEAMGTTAGEKSLLYQVEQEQPLVQALYFENKMVRYSAAIAIAAAGPQEYFIQSRVVVSNLAEALDKNEQSDIAETEAAGLPWNETIADNYALRSATVMLQLAQSRNPVIDLSGAQDALIRATSDEQTQVLAAQTLAYLSSPDAQRAIARMALDNSNSNEVRISAFNALVTSAKINANMLDDELIDSIYLLISDTAEASAEEIRSAAASAYGALNLSSQKVKDLILDQAKS